MMPAMFSLALHPALRALQPELLAGEQALAYLDVDVEVADKHIEGDGRTSFAAHPGGSTLERAAPRTKNTRARAGCEMVAVRIMDCAAPASGRGQRQRQPESAEQTRKRGDSRVNSGRVGRVVRTRAA